MTIPVVVVDDDEIDRYVIKRVLQASGVDANLVEYTDGKAFVDVIQDEQKRREQFGTPPPSILVFLDINMPIMDGFEVLSTLEKMDLNDEYLFITMYSSSSHAEDKTQALGQELVVDYIVKPLTNETFQALVDKLYRQ